MASLSALIAGIGSLPDDTRRVVKASRAGTDSLTTRRHTSRYQSRGTACRISNNTTDLHSLQEKTARRVQANRIVVFIKRARRWLIVTHELRQFIGIAFLDGSRRVDGAIG